MHSILKVATQVERVVQKANGMRVLIDQGTEYKNEQVIGQLYISLVRLYLKYCALFWLPQCRKWVFERGQNRFTRMVPGLDCISYEAEVGHI